MYMWAERQQQWQWACQMCKNKKTEEVQMEQKITGQWYKQDKIVSGMMVFYLNHDPSKERHENTKITVFSARKDKCCAKYLYMARGKLVKSLWIWKE